MTSKSRNILIVVGLLIAIFIGYQAYINKAGTGTVGDNKLKVAILAPETGNLAFMGVPIRNALELALENNRESLRKDGIDIELIAVDSKGNPKDAVTGVNRALDIDRANVVVTFLSGVTNAVAPVVNAKGAFLVGLTVDPTFLKKDDPTAVRVFFNYKKQGELLAQICEQRKYEKLLIFHSTDQSSTYSMETIFMPLIKSAGKTFEKETFNVGQRDFKDIVAKHAKSNAQAIVLEGFGSEFPMLVSTIRATPGLRDLPIISTLGCMGVKTELQLQMAGVEFIAPRFVVKDPDQVYQKLQKTFAERYPTAAFSYTAVYALDGFDVIAYAARNAGNKDGRSLFNALQGKTVKTASDNYRFDASGDYSPAMALSKFDKNGNIVYIEDIQ